MTNNNDNGSVSRRTFVQTTAAATAAMMFPGGASVAGSDVIRVGVIGCGGRGTGAAMDVMRSSDGVEVVALGDLLPDRLAQCRDTLAKETAGNAALAAKYKVTSDRAFTGFDAYKKVLATDIDLVILATPPGFRPTHLAAAVAAGKHIFTEKPVAVDAAGIRSVLATDERAKQKSLGVVVGTQRRHQADYIATDPAHPRRRDRRASWRTGVLESGRPLEPARQAGVDATPSGRFATGCTSPGSPATTSSSSTSTTSTSRTG